MKILLKGYYGYGNFGDDILMIVSYDLIKTAYPDSTITVFSNNTPNNPDSEVDKDYNKYILDYLNEEVKRIDWTNREHFDLILHGGGGTYFDSTPGQSILFNKILNLLPLRLIASFDKLVRLILRKNHRVSYKRRVGIGIGIGEYSSGSSLYYDHLAELGSYDKIFVRDGYSVQFLRSHFINKYRLTASTDLAFRFDWSEYSKWNRQQVKSIGIVIKDNIPNQLKKDLENFYNYLSRKGIRVNFYSFDENYDIDTAKRFAKYDLIQYNPPHLSKFIKELAKEDLLYTSRAHGTIIGGCLGIPSIIFNLEIKLAEVAKMLPDSSILLTELSYEALINCFERIYTEYDLIVKNLNVEVNRHVEESSRLMDYVTE